MKNRKSIVVLLMVLVGLVNMSCSTTKKAVSNEVTGSKNSSLLKSGSFTIDVDKTFGVKGELVNLAPGHFLQISGDSAFCVLPFYGMAYTAPSNMRGGGIEFQSKMMNIRRRENVKNRYELTFDVILPEGSCRVNLLVWPDGVADINIAPISRSISRYMGQLRLAEKP